MAWRGCVGKWTTTSRNIRLNPNNQQRCDFRQEAKRPKTNKGDVTQQTDRLPSETVDGVARKTVPPSPGPQPPHKTEWPKLIKPLIFTVGFTGSSFGIAAIMQYESLKSRVQIAKQDNSVKLEQGSQDVKYWWWNQLTSLQKQLILLISTADDLWSRLTEGQRTAMGIIAVNTVILCCWRVPSMQRTMIKYFTSNPASKTLCLPMVLSTFSHYSVIHMVANMYVLWTLSSGMVSLLGREQFLAVYLSAGVISTMVSYMCKTAAGRLHPSLGASGAVMAVLAAFCTKAPEAKLGILFLPMVTFTAGKALNALVAVDTVGLVLGWRLLDHAAHLGGALFGVWYVAYGHKVIWRKREPLVRLWHNMRSR